MSTTRTLWISIGLALLTLPLAAQKQRLPRHKVDRYTQNHPKVLAKLGYVSFGPFEFGTRGSKTVTTDVIEKDLSYAQFRWIETAHFRIGSTLDSWNVPMEPKTRKKIRAELTLLQKRGLPRVTPKKRVIDEWLRLHLIAQRMEQTYAEIQSMLGVTDADFPADASKVVTNQGRYMGFGPYLGQKGKYLILVCENESTFKDYLKRYVGRDSGLGHRWHFKQPGSLFYGVAATSGEARLRHDTALHCNLVFNVAHNLIDGFRHYSYNMPVWITAGLAHWFERRVDPRWNSFDENEGSLIDKKTVWKWEQKTRQLLAGKKGTPLSEAYTWRDYGQIDFDDQILIWSRWDYLLSLGHDKFADFMMQVKGRVDPVTWRADPNNLVGATRDALSKTYGLTPLSFDEKWRAWVIKTYPAQ